jgi:hypothetical protein
MTALGVTDEEKIDAMTLDGLAAIQAHWRRVPPTDELVAAYLGYKPRKPSMALDGKFDAAALVASLNAGMA